MKATPLRWTLGMVATEFGIDRRTVATRVKTAGVVPAEDGCFSTAQITKALHGDLAGERLRKLRAEADLAEVEAEEAQKTRIPLRLVLEEDDKVFRAIATIIKASKLSREEKQDIFTELRAHPAQLAQHGYPVPENQDVLAGLSIP